jgi:hypothetical protein
MFFKNCGLASAPPRRLTGPGAHSDQARHVLGGSGSAKERAVGLFPTCEFATYNDAAHQMTLASTQKVSTDDNATR